MPNWSLISIRDLSGDKGSFEIDMWVSNPTKMSGDEEAKEKVVAVISNIYWAGGTRIQCTSAVEFQQRIRLGRQHNSIQDTMASIVKFKLLALPTLPHL
ncbi:hypothetical protein CWB72_19490 [Pseudoalteromonas phenolica]|uniref:hypothetical protein n=1 Tax=Pseudoalteromonas phenolica TaxID=161398 RepID=UPI00110BACFA|nr:hypothetical protein [Pseudoalteromonas phenolica]TMN86528.1 hypothetical protein CWB72_19490 [Pseudoalteromonas phenolica]